MATSPDLTLREAAELAGVTPTTVEKAVEAKVIRPLTRPARLRGGSTRYVPLQAVAYFAALKQANLVDLPVRLKKALWRGLVGLEARELAPIELSPGVVLHLDELANEPFEAALCYRASRDAHIMADPEILGGTPMIRGTRITVYSVLGRLQDGDSVDDLVADNPDVPRQAFEAAAIFARAHPLRGRPGGRPWRPIRRAEGHEAACDSLEPPGPASDFPVGQLNERDSSGIQSD